MTKNDIFNYPGLVISIAVWIAGFIIFFRDTGEWIGSFSAAALLAGLFWVSYVIVRWLVMAFKKD